MKNMVAAAIAAGLFSGFIGLASVQGGVIFNPAMAPLGSVEVYKIVKVHDRKDISDALEEARSKGLKIAIAGARHAQGGQQSYPNGIVLDMIEFNKILSLDQGRKLIRVQSGATWKQVQDYIRPYGDAVRVMQDTNSLTVGGSLSSNVHGDDPNYGSIIESVRSFRFMQADGKVINVSRAENPELFSLVIGGYGLFGVILDVDLLLTDNATYQENIVFMDYKKYPEFLRSNIVNNTQIGGQDAVFVELKQGDFKTLRVATYVRVEGDTVQKKGYVSRDDRFMPKPFKYKEQDRAFVQEYFIPVSKFVAFIDGLRAIFKSEHIVKVRPYFVRYAKQDKQSFLPYAKTDSVAVSIAVGAAAQKPQDIQDLTRRVVGLTLGCGGTFYLTKMAVYPDREQVLKAYPEFIEFEKQKEKYDPQGVFMSQFYEHYR